jgi:hypothetical protein
MRLENPSQGPSPDGYGICLPRLHWTTFLGSAYTAALRDRLAIPCDAFVIIPTSNGVLIRLRCSPQEASQKAEVEARAIKHLGVDYFWDTRDDWRKPRRRYRMPELDWSSILTNS